MDDPVVEQMERRVRLRRRDDLTARKVQRRGIAVLLIILLAFFGVLWDRDRRQNDLESANGRIAALVARLDDAVHQIEAERRDACIRDNKFRQSVRDLARDLGAEEDVFGIVARRFPFDEHCPHP